MKKIVFALTLVSSLVQPFTSVLAADFEPPPPPTDDLRPASYDWSGLYVGASLGATCIDGSTSFVSAGPPASSVSLQKEGCGGDLFGYTGYRAQMDNIVFGYESELGMMFGDMYDGAPSPTTLTLDLSTGIKGHVGYAMDNNLIYGLVGYNFARGTYGETSGTIAAPITTSESGWHHGWSVGMGYERAITDVIRVRAEYAYMQLNSGDYASACTSCTAVIDFGNIHTFRLGVSYAF